MALSTKGFRSVPMRTLILVLAAAVLHSSTPRSADGQHTGAIFREVSISPLGTLVLGRPVAPGAALLPEVASGVRRMPPGFGDTRAIDLFLGQADTLSAILFWYDVPADEAGDDFVERSTSYTDDLGSPRTVLVVKDDAPERAARLCAVWDDGETRFEVGVVVTADGDAVFSYLTTSDSDATGCVSDAALASSPPPTG